MAKKTVGVLIEARDALSALKRIQKVEALGIPAVWLTGTHRNLDALTLFASATAHTKEIKMGTAITPTFPRHPIVTAQQVQVIAQLAAGRFRLGVGPGHKSGTEGTFGLDFKAPISQLREYIRIVKTLLQKGSVDFDGQYYHAHSEIPAPVDVPVMASALRRTSFELCGAEADGAISWVCPGNYLRDVAIPAMKVGAEKAQRAVPPLIAHAPVSVHDNPEEVYASVREQIINPRLPFYQRMFVDAGFPEATNGLWSDEMIEATVLYGNEEQVAAKLRQLFDFGVGEILVSLVAAGGNRAASVDRTLQVVAEVAKASL